MEFKEGVLYDSYVVSEYVMNLHYPAWDTQGREESDIESRIEKHARYILKTINISETNDYNDYYIDEDIVNEFAEMKAGTMPPIVVTVDGNRYCIVDGCHRILSQLKRGENTILALVPVSK